MGSFASIYAIAAVRKGGPEALEALIAEHRPKTHDQIAATPDDRLLAMMTERVFQAGFSWTVIENKWPGFEAAFDGFDLNACAYPTEEKFDALLKDARIVRNARKILSVQANARFLLGLAQEAGTAARFFAGRRSPSDRLAKPSWKRSITSADVMPRPARYFIASGDAFNVRQ